MAGAAGVAGVAIGMLGSAIGKGDGDAATFKKEKKGVLMSSTLKGVGTGASLGTTIMPGWNCNRRRSRSSSRVISGLFKSKNEEGSQNTYW
jgi:hypothetical protein